VPRLSFGQMEISQEAKTKPTPILKSFWSKENFWLRCVGISVTIICVYHYLKLIIITAAT